MNDATGLPDEVSDLLDSLRNNGFRPWTERGQGAVNRMIELRSHNFGVRVIADRGEWWVEAGALSQADWFDADVWRACMEGPPASFDPSPFHDQARYFLEHIADLPEAALKPDTAECLSRTRARRARERLGLPPSVEGE